MKYNLKINYFNSPRVFMAKTNVLVYKTTIPKSVLIDEFDLIWGSIYANKQNRHIHNLNARLEYDTSLVHYLFNMKSPIDLEINADILSLEQTQKTAMMNRAGAILCNVVAKKCFGIKHLNHLQNLRGMNINNTGKKYPDFIARHNNDYFIFEAKGTSLRKCLKQEKSAIEQLNSIATINGNIPYKYLIQTTVHNNKFWVDLVDPIEGQENLQISDDEFNDYKFDVNDLPKFYINKLEKYSKGYFFGDYYVGYVLIERANESKNEDFIIENSILNNSTYTGKVFSDGTIILKKH